MRNLPRPWLIGVAATVVAALLAGHAAHSRNVGILCVAAVVSVLLLINYSDARTIAVDYVWRFVSRRRPDITEGRITAYVIAWSCIIIAIFVLIMRNVVTGAA